MSSISPDLLVLGCVAGFILFRLYVTLGRKDDDSEISIIKSNKTILQDAIDISKTAKIEDTELDLLEKDLSVGFEDVVTRIKKLEAEFSLHKFLEGAKAAFEIILNAFAANERSALKDLLSEKIYKQFTNEIDKRIANQISLSLTLVSLPLVKIKTIVLRNNKITIEVLYESQQINIIKDKNGNIIEGSASEIDNIEDVWTFEKECNVDNRNWKLVKVNAD